jgi:hypothetical protein
MYKIACITKFIDLRTIRPRLYERLRLRAKQRKKVIANPIRERDKDGTYESGGVSRESLEMEKLAIE